MGIPGLTSFIDENSHFLQSHKLHDTRLIIDGNNLFHVLYYDNHVPHQYGGDYDTFARTTRDFFKTLQASNIIPYVVFDGAYESDDRKLNTTLSRCKERICLAGFLSHGGRAKILPILADAVFIEVLNELNINHATCDFEADEEIAALANKWSCPVLSNDSDFFIFPLTGGYIPLDYFQRHVYKEETNDSHGNCNVTKYLKVQIYYTKNLLELFSLTKEILPLFATLLGNDYVDRKTFDTVFSQLRLPSVGKKVGKKLGSNRFQKFSGLLSWLHQYNCVEDAMKDILAYFKEEKQQQITLVIQKSIHNYSVLCTKLDAYFDSKVMPAELIHTTSFNDSNLPEWFVVAFRQSNLSVNVMNLLCLRRILLACQIEDMDQCSAYESSKSVRQILYGLIIKKDCDANYSDDSNDVIVEYDRVEKKQVKNVVQPVLSLETYGNLPNVSEISDLDQETRRRLMLESLGAFDKVACISFLSDGMKFLIGIIVHWINNSEPKITENHLRALLVCILKLCCIDGQRHNRITCMMSNSNLTPVNKYEEKAGDVMGIKCSENSVLMNAGGNLKKFVNEPKHSFNNVFDISVIHGYSQFQACFQVAIYLNKLLRSPLPNLNPANIYNGTFIYNLCRELKCRANPDLYISELLGRNGELDAAFEKLQTAVTGCLASDVFLLEEKTFIKNSKKRRGYRNEESNCNAKEVYASETKKTDKKKAKVELKAACELNNRFGGLAISSDSDSDS